MGLKMKNFDVIIEYINTQIKSNTYIFNKSKEDENLHIEYTTIMNLKDSSEITNIKSYTKIYQDLYSILKLKLTSTDVLEIKNALKTAFREKINEYKEKIQGIDSSEEPIYEIIKTSEIKKIDTKLKL